MRKRWTAKTDITTSLLDFREKRKWQIALRRYVLEKKAGSSSYAPYFGLDIVTFRKWIETQFDSTLNWDNFSEAWQFDHIVPIAYFDFSNQEDLKLCWNFTNISVQKIKKEGENDTLQLDCLGAKTYFQQLYSATSYSICLKMLEKIKLIEAAQLSTTIEMKSFLLKNITLIQTATTFSSYEYAKLNEDTSLTEVLAEKELFKKFAK